MIGNLLILLSISIILFAYLNLFINYWKSKKNINIKLTGFELAKEITSNYDEINIVESKNVWVSQYDMRRNIIRLIPSDYEGTNIFSLSVVSQLAGYSLLNIEGNSYLKILTKIFSKINCFLISSGIGILISLFTNTVGDAKIGLILLSIILVYQYFRIQIQDSSNRLLKLDKLGDNLGLFQKVDHSFLVLHKSSFIVTLILMLREVIIILGI